MGQIESDAWDDVIRAEQGRKEELLKQKAKRLREENDRLERELKERETEQNKPKP